MGKIIEFNDAKNKIDTDNYLESCEYNDKVMSIILTCKYACMCFMIVSFIICMICLCTKYEGTLAYVGVMAFFISSMSGIIFEVIEYYVNMDEISG